jgi:hypothetical protein
MAEKVERGYSQGDQVIQAVERVLDEMRPVVIWPNGGQATGP